MENRARETFLIAVAGLFGGILSYLVILLIQVLNLTSKENNISLTSSNVMPTNALMIGQLGSRIVSKRSFQ